jgi:hypothetical protein
MPRPTTRTHTPACSKPEAEAHLIATLSGWRAQLGTFLDDTGGNPYSPSRSWQALMRAHNGGKLLAYMTEWLDEYKSLPCNGYADAMVQIVKCGQRTWEHILLEPNQPWTPYITDRQRAALLKCLTDCYKRAASEMDLRASIAA